MGLFDNVFGSTISAIGGILGNSSSAKEASKSREMSIDAAQHAHQWEVADLKAAGLNPILSANSGASVSSLPMGIQSNPFNGVGDTYNSAKKINEVDKKAIEIQSDAQKSQEDYNKAAAGAQDALKNKAASEKVLADEQAALTRMTSVNKIMERNNISLQQAAIEAQAQRDYTQAHLNSANEAAAAAAAANTKTHTKLSEREIRTGQYDEKVEQYTRPVRNIIDTITTPIRGIFHKSSNTTRFEQ